MPSFEVDSRKGILILRCFGKITFEITSELKKEMSKRISEESFKHLVVDLSRVEFMDSSGIGALVAMHSKVFGSGGRFSLLAPSEQVRNVLNLVKLSGYFQTLESEEDLDFLEE